VISTITEVLESVYLELLDRLIQVKFLPANNWQCTYSSTSCDKGLMRSWVLTTGMVFLLIFLTKSVRVIRGYIGVILVDDVLEGAVTYFLFTIRIYIFHLIQFNIYN
jgi:hypothetical protein